MPSVIVIPIDAVAIYIIAVATVTLLSNLHDETTLTRPGVGPALALLVHTIIFAFTLTVTTSPGWLEIIVAPTKDGAEYIGYSSLFAGAVCWLQFLVFKRSESELRINNVLTLFCDVAVRHVLQVAWACVGGHCFGDFVGRVWLLSTVE